MNYCKWFKVLFAVLAVVKINPIKGNTRLESIPQGMDTTNLPEHENTNSCPSSLIMIINPVISSVVISSPLFTAAV